MKVLLTTDVFFHPLDHKPTNHRWLLELLKSAVEAANSVTNVAIVDDVLQMHRVRSTDLCKAPYTPHQGEQLQVAQRSIEHIVSEFDVVVGFELSQPTLQWLERINVHYVVAYLHPVRFHSDWLFSVSSNSTEYSQWMATQSIPDSELRVLATFWKQAIIERDLATQFDTPTALVVGQTVQDMSVWNGTKMLALQDFHLRLTELTQQYDRVLYKPHPLELTNDGSLIEMFPSMTIIQNSIYELLSSNLATCVAVSSSVVAEASFFGVAAEYLWQPLAGTVKGATIGKSFISGSFWKGLFDGHVEAVEETQQIVVSNPDVFIRDVRQAYWSYLELQEIVRRPRPHKNRRTLIQRLFKK